MPITDAALIEVIISFVFISILQRKDIELFKFDAPSKNNLIAENQGFNVKELELEVVKEDEEEKK